MFTEEDDDKIAELKQYEIPQWCEELESIVGREVELEVDWESTYTLSPSLEPDIPLAGERLIDTFREACEDEVTRSLLARRLHRVLFVCVPPYHGFGCVAEEDTIHFRTWVYPRTDEEIMLLDDYVRMLRQAAQELDDPGPEEDEDEAGEAPSFTDALARSVAEMREQYDEDSLAEVRRDMQIEIAEAEALDPASTDAEGNTALHVCAAYGCDEIGWCLAHRGASLTARNAAGETPLHTAMRHGQETMALVLLFSGADPGALDAEGRDAVGIARAMDREWVADSIADQISEPDPDELPNQILMLAASEGLAAAEAPSDLAEFGEMLSMMGESMAPSVEGRTGLHRAAVSDEIERAMLDLTQRADVDTVDAEGNTALHLAVAADTEDLVELLLKLGAKADIPNNLGRTAADWAGWLDLPEIEGGSGEDATVADWLDLLPRLGMDPSRHELAFAGFAKGGEEAVRGLIESLADDNMMTVELARQALVRIGAPAVDPLRAAVNDAPPVARAMSVQALGEIAAEGVETAGIAEFLIDTVSRTDLENVPLPTPAAFAGAQGLTVYTISEAIRGAGCEALGMIGEPASAAVDPLVALLSDESEIVRGSAIGALCALGEKGNDAVVAYATGPDAPPPEAFMGIIDQLGDAPPPPAILDMLARIDVPQGLSNLGRKLEPWLSHGDPTPELVGLTMSMLSSSDLFAKSGAERALESCGSLPESALPSVVTVLRSDKPFGGLLALKKMELEPEQKGELAPDLAAILRDNDDYKSGQVVQEVLAGFGRSGAPATENLLEVLGTENHRNFQAAAEILGAVATSPEVVGVLEKILIEKDMSAAKGAAKGLGNMGALAKGALPSLEAKSDDFFAGDLAKEAIEKINAEL